MLFRSPQNPKTPGAFPKNNKMVESSVRELLSGQVKDFVADKNDRIVFYFDVNEKDKIEIITTPMDEKSSADIFIANPSLFTSEREASEECDVYKHTWKSDKVGENRILVLPSDKNH